MIGTQRKRGRSLEDRGRSWSRAAIVSEHPEPPEARRSKGHFSPKVFGGIKALRHLEFGLVTSRSVRE